MNNGVQTNMFPSDNTQLYHSQQPAQFIGGNNPSATAARLLPDELNQFSYSPDVMYCSDSNEFKKTSTKTDQSGLSYIYSRKRSREAAAGVDNEEEAYYYRSVDPPRCSSSAMLGELDLLPQFHQHQFDIDALISQHTKKIRLEMEERQKQKARLLLSSFREGILMKRLREREAQILKMGKVNLALQEKVKSLYIENQLWRDLAQANEATANSLRSNLEQLLSMNGGERAHHVEDDAESCCGSSGGDDVVVVRRLCNLCGERESCVMVLPCRHLCLCGGCGGGSRAVTVCPVCSASTNATLHVNMASS